MTVVVVCILSRIPFKYWAFPLLIFAMIGTISAFHLPYVSARLKVYLHPELDLKGKGHQPYQAKIAAGSGQLMGRGPGNSLQKLSYLPEAQNDYIAAIYAEEFQRIVYQFTHSQEIPCQGSAKIREEEIE